MRLLRTVVAAFVVCVAATLVGPTPASAEPGAAGAPLAAGDTVSVPDGVTAGFAVYDRRRGELTASRNPHTGFRSASVVKLLIALDELIQHDPELDLDQAATDEQRQEILALRTMLRSSWDYAASAFWVKNGFTDVIDRMTSLIGLTETSPPAQRGVWGYTFTTVTDVVKIYNYLLDEAPARYRDFIVGNLYAATRCAEDGRDQSFGIPQAFGRPWGVKQGWSGWGPTVPEDQRCVEDRAGMSEFAGALPAMEEEPDPQPDLASPLLHTTGIVGPDKRTVVVVLTTYPADTTWPDGAAAITQLCRALLPFVPDARPDLDRLG